MNRWVGLTLTLQQQIQSVQRGAVLGGLNTLTIANLQIAAPPISEQGRLLDRIESETSGSNRSIANVEQQISLLREYRTRLIADVVTGKLDVREAAAQLPDETEEREPLDEVEVLAEDSGNSEGADLDAVPEEAEA